MQNFKDYVTDLYIIEYAESQDIDINELTEEELNELIGKAIGGAFKLGAKSVVGAARLAKKGANRMSVSGRADAAEKKAKALEKKKADRERLAKMKQKVRDTKKAMRTKPQTNNATA